MMEKFTFIDYNQFSSFMQNKDFQANNIVFWTGAGIDCDTPTCLPLGAALTEKILSWTCGDMGAELFKKWGEICKAVNSLCWPKEKLHLSSIPRLESILERVRLCEKQSSIDGSNNSVMTMISGFSDAPPNPSHYALAKAISEGASVVTTNYSLTYKFTHRSFQEYYSAIFLKELSDQNMEKMGISLVKKDYFRASHDSVFFMLRDMAEQRFEQNILLPFVVEFETTCSDTDKYDFYFEELSPEIFFDEVDFDGEIHLVICADFNVEAVGFIYAMARHYRDTTSSHVKQLKDAEDELRNFLISERDYKIEEKVDLTEYRDDSKLYSLLKATWIGDYLTVMANLREMLEHRRRKEEQDLFELLDE